MLAVLSVLMGAHRWRRTHKQMVDMLRIGGTAPKASEAPEANRSDVTRQRSSGAGFSVRTATFITVPDFVNTTFYCPMTQHIVAERVAEDICCCC